MTFRDFDKHHRPKRNLAIRISTHALGVMGMAIATYLGNRKEKKRQAKLDAIRKAREDAHR